MLVTSSSSRNDSFPALDLSPFIPTASFNMYCFISSQSNFSWIGFYIVRISLLILLCSLILYHCVQQWWQKHSNSSTTALSHSDIFTYHTVIIELIGVFGNALCCHGILWEDLSTLFWGVFIWTLSWCGESMFHSLTCLEHYLAVVHPIIYMYLRNEKGIRIRNVGIGCAWLLSFMGMGSMMMESVFVILNFCLLTFTLLVVSFCCLSVLYVLIRPGPGEQGGTGERADQSKKRAFNAIVAIFVALTLRFLGNLVWLVVYVSQANSGCLILVAVLWLSLPSCLVLPLLFLHRAGKLMCCWKTSS